MLITFEIINKTLSSQRVTLTSICKINASIKKKNTHEFIIPDTQPHKGKM